MRSSGSWERRLASKREELVEKGGQRGIEVLVVGLLHQGGVDGLCKGPQRVVSFTVKDDQLELRLRIGSSILLVGIRRAVGRIEAQLKNQIGL